MAQQKVKPKKTSVTVERGPLAGMEFAEVKTVSETRERIVLVYQAPHDGPKALVEHVKAGGEYSTASKQNAVRIAFSKLIPASVQWAKENGYKATTSGTPLVWDHRAGRFVTAPAIDEAKETE